MKKSNQIELRKEGSSSRSQQRRAHFVNDVNKNSETYSKSQKSDKSVSKRTVRVKFDKIE